MSQDGANVLVQWCQQGHRMVGVSLDIFHVFNAEEFQSVIKVVHTAVIV